MSELGALPAFNVFIADISSSVVRSRSGLGLQMENSMPIFQFIVNMIVKFLSRFLSLPLFRKHEATVLGVIVLFFPWLSVC